MQVTTLTPGSLARIQFDFTPKLPPFPKPVKEVPIEEDERPKSGNLKPKTPKSPKTPKPPSGKNKKGAVEEEEPPEEEEKVRN
jgi:hypothetical protein